MGVPHLRATVRRNVTPNQLVAAIVSHRIRHHTGGPLHIVVEDGNIEDRHLDFAADKLRTEPHSDPDTCLIREDICRGIADSILIGLRWFDPATRAFIIDAPDLFAGKWDDDADAITAAARLAAELFNPPG